MDPHPMTPLLLDQAAPRERGRAHGEAWRAEIGELAAIRLELTLANSSLASAAEVREAAAAHLPPLATHAPALSEELLGIGDGAALEPADIVVLNHYTDLRDVPRSVLEPGCTAVYLAAEDGAVLGQTWDMHASAERFVRTIRVQPKGSEEEAVVFTLTGCVGMAGLGHHGVAVTINNLNSTDGQIGLAWPVLVRKLIAQRTATEALELLRATPLSSGHHYMIADGSDFFGVECSAQLKVLTQQGAKSAHLHTNHCFDPVLRQREQVPPDSTTFARLNMATTLYAQQRPRRAEQLWDLLGSHDGHPVSICSHAVSKTCGRLLMRPGTGALKVSRGCSRDDDGLDLHVERFSR